MTPKHAAPSAAAPFTRAALDRNMTVNTGRMARALGDLDLSGLAVLEFGCGTGNILRLLRSTNAKTIYAFEVIPEGIDPDIRAWAEDPDAKPRLVINPQGCRLNTRCVTGDMTGYDYDCLLQDHNGFAIIGNPPYFLYNRILSMTQKDKFSGAMMITSRGRLGNHPGWHILDVMDGADFNPPAYGTQYLLQTGFRGRTSIDRTGQPFIHGNPQIYPPIANRDPAADISDFYPEMWQQLDSLKP